MIQKQQREVAEILAKKYNMDVDEMIKLLDSPFEMFAAEMKKLNWKTDELRNFKIGSYIKFKIKKVHHKKALKNIGYITDEDEDI